jgi:hypothetical protein
MRPDAHSAATFPTSTTNRAVEAMFDRIARYDTLNRLLTFHGRRLAPKRHARWRCPIPLGCSTRVVPATQPRSSRPATIRRCRFSTGMLRAAHGGAARPTPCDCPSRTRPSTASRADSLRNFAASPRPRRMRSGAAPGGRRALDVAEPASPFVRSIHAWFRHGCRRQRSSLRSCRAPLPPGIHRVLPSRPSSSRSSFGHRRRQPALGLGRLSSSRNPDEMTRDEIRG